MAQQVDVSRLPNETLSSLYKQLQAEHEALSRTLPVIQQGLQLCQNAINAINTLQHSKKDNQALVPFTESCYVYAQISDAENFLVNLGGGYCAELSKQDAVKFYENRIGNRKAELNKIRSALGHNQLTKEQIEMEVRGREAYAKQQGQKTVE
ncbi:Prefoldin subunit [Spironucleus salmonicida]|uniref:Prefoldin subunit n=1 Tax=Spironucleus salmonicida TaxID=348837 RepID=V6LSN3_9EUKA|nr:Prefoldin subunit [Spironucleus salmonicida]|eukprot:EST47253.1 Prefoldin subunit-containing protein [Spironucleus salmonicida]